MKSFTRALAKSGEIITPHELNTELRDVVGTMHALDRHNVPAFAITRGKVAAGAFGRWLIDPITTARNTDHTAGQNGQVYYPIPDEAGEPWIKTFLTGDGGLVVGLHVSFGDVTSVTPTQLYTWVGVLVDGALVAQSPISHVLAYRDHLSIEYEVPVGAGYHRIEAVYGLHVAALAAARTYSWFDRILFAREVSR